MTLTHLAAGGLLLVSSDLYPGQQRGSYAEPGVENIKYGKLICFKHDDLEQPQNFYLLR